MCRRLPRRHTLPLTLTPTLTLAPALALALTFTLTLTRTRTRTLTLALTFTLTLTPTLPLTTGGIIFPLFFAAAALAHALSAVVPATLMPVMVMALMASTQAWLP